MLKTSNLLSTNHTEKKDPLPPLYKETPPEMLRSTFNSWREYLTPASHNSTFTSTGEITPSEFVEAGDYLTYKFPTWQWSPAPNAKLERDFLPKDKQFLVTRKVPSYVRAEAYLGEGEDLVQDEVDEDGWTRTAKPDFMNGDDKREPKKEDVIEDIDELIDETAEDFDQDETPDNSNKNNKSKRSYDLFIHYSTAYRVPRMYLIGYDSNGSPLSPEAMFEDISSDYRDKTVTIEKAPFLKDTTTISIHPCRHAAVMKVLINRAMIAAKNRQTYNKSVEKDLIKGVKVLGLANNEDEGEWEDVREAQEVKEIEQGDVVRVDQYLVIFLKFITSVTPGIEHDYTMDAF